MTGDPAPARIPGPPVAHRFKPGQSGNPEGRRNIPLSVARLARDHTTEAIATLVKLMRKSRSEDMRKCCAQELLTRGWGKPAQVVGIIGGVDPGFGGTGDGKQPNGVLSIDQKVEILTLLADGGDAALEEVFELPSAQEEAERMLA